MKLEAYPKDGFSFDASDTMYPSRLRVVRDCRIRIEVQSTTIFGVVLNGVWKVKSGAFSTELPQGGFFSCRSVLDLEGEGAVAIFERIGFVGIPMAGVCEGVGRLSYIDGCSSSILVLPPRCGDPVLNHLHFPPGVVQSEHVHPSIRFGAVLSGSGTAFGSNPDGSQSWETTLVPGAVFYLSALERHAFSTEGKSEPLNIISFHPDSDWGPSDQNHPMQSRTFLVSKK